MLAELETSKPGHVNTCSKIDRSKDTVKAFPEICPKKILSDTNKQLCINQYPHFSSRAGKEIKAIRKKNSMSLLNVF